MLQQAVTVRCLLPTETMRKFADFVDVAVADA